MTVPPDDQIIGIIEFYEQAVTDGSLVGDGNGQSPEKRLNALGNMLDSASDSIINNDISEACDQLYQVLRRIDGEGNPPDFAGGVAAADLSVLIDVLRSQLDCPNN